MQNYIYTSCNKFIHRVACYLLFGVILFILGVYELIRYYVYNMEYKMCMFNNFKVITFIIASINLIIGGYLIYISYIQYGIIHSWREGHISNHIYWNKAQYKYNSVIVLIALILQFSVIAFMTCHEFQIFNSSGCDQYLYYVLISNVMFCYNILFIIMVICVVIYMLICVLYILYILYSICNGCLTLFKNATYMNTFGIFIRRPTRPAINIHHAPVDNIIVQTTIGNTQLINKHSCQTIIKIIPEHVQIMPITDCIICMEIQTICVKFKYCSHWVCKVCWSKLIHTNPICPLCREIIA